VDLEVREAGVSGANASGGSLERHSRGVLPLL